MSFLLTYYERFQFPSGVAKSLTWQAFDYLSVSFVAVRRRGREGLLLSLALVNSLPATSRFSELIG
ncbi:hypothetical protein [Brucella pseudogrignonensis]|uniref:hypothetical protein n=1 Tax=Brucella pseudogrignonensis TaxID=419475 RepID=UPI003D981AE4